MNTDLKRKAKNLSGAKAGFTLIEFLIVFAVIFAAGSGTFLLTREFFRLADFFEQSFTLDRDASAALRGIIMELREVAPSESGAYPLEIAQPTNIAFYADIDADFTRERIQYFLQGTDLRKSIIKPAGPPLTYATSSGAQETVRTILRHVVASSTVPLFSYFDGTYAGTSTPLIPPLDVLSVRHVRVTFMADETFDFGAPPAFVTSDVTPRRLKTNL